MEGGFSWSLNDMMSGFTEVNTNLSVTGPVDTAIPENSQQPLIDLISEALSNVQRHAQTDDVDIQIAVAETEVRLIIADNGVGMQGRRPGRGMNRMTDLASQAGGTIEFTDTAGGGVTITVMLTGL
jgi:signal transduction histidine kinase